MNNIITKLIKEYGEEKDFFGAVSEIDIRNAENSLGLKFPSSYRAFVENYGSGGICGVEIVGIQAGFGASVVKATERWRKLGLDIKLIVVEDLGEFARCMYSADANDDRVFSCNRGESELTPRYKTFDEYLIDIFHEGIDNL